MYICTFYKVLIQLASPSINSTSSEVYLHLTNKRSYGLIQGHSGSQPGFSPGLLIMSST